MAKTNSIPIPNGISTSSDSDSESETDNASKTFISMQNTKCEKSGSILSSSWAHRIFLTEAYAAKSSTILPWVGCLLWPMLLAVPLILSCSPLSYDKIFPASWYEYDGKPKPLGLSLGILAVAVGQIHVLIFFYLYKHGFLGCTPRAIQAKGARKYDWSEGVATHLAQPEGFVLLVLYLSITWMFNLMPESYYSFKGTIQIRETFLCLVIQDGIQYAMHRLEHVVSMEFYR